MDHPPRLKFHQKGKKNNTKEIGYQYKEEKFE